MFKELQKIMYKVIKESMKIKPRHISNTNKERNNERQYTRNSITEKYNRNDK